MSEENKNRGQSSADRETDELLESLFAAQSDRHDDGDAAAEKKADDGVSEDAEDILGEVFEEPEAEISDRDYSDILSEVLGSDADVGAPSDESGAEDEDTAAATNADDGDGDTSDRAELLKKVMAFSRAAENDTPAETGTVDLVDAAVKSSETPTGSEEEAEKPKDPGEAAGDAVSADAHAENEAVDTDVAVDEAAEKPDGTVGIDDEDRDLMLALGYGTDDSGEMPPKPAAGAKSDLGRHMTDLRSDYACAFGYRGAEYRSADQTESIKKAYRSDSVMLMIRAVGTGILALLILIFELFGKHFGGALSAADFPTVHILVSLQLLLLAAALSWRQLTAGLFGIFRFELTPHSAAAAAVTVVLLYDILLAAVSPDSFTLYNFPAVLCILLSVIYDVLDCKRQSRTFDALSSWESCCTLEAADPVALATALSASGKRDDAKIASAMRLRRGKFAENYFKHTNRKNPALRILNYVIAPVIALSLAVFLIALAAGRGFVPSLNTFTVMVLIAMPVFTMAALIYPFWDMTRNLLGSGAVLLNETEADAYADTDAVVFDEEDVFGQRSLVIKKIGLCGGIVDGDVFGILDGASAVFDKVGGALAGAFRRAAEGAETNSSGDAEILDVCEGGIVAAAKGRRYLIGGNAFMSANGIAAPFDSDDEAFAADGGSAVMYIAVDGEVALKLYVSYLADSDFRDTVTALSERGIRPIMTSNDPNIDDALMARMLGEMKCPVRVIRNKAALVASDDDAAAVAAASGDEKVDACLIADGEDWSVLIGAVTACGKLRRTSKLNMNIGIGTICLSVLLAAFLGALGILYGMSSAYVALYQVICVLPAVISSKLLLN